MISMIVKICTCCNQLADACDFQRTLRELRADRFADIFIEEREVGECTTSLLESEKVS